MTTQPASKLVSPFTRETAIQKVRRAEDGWNSRNSQQDSLAYTPDS
jgi:nuclear transport factor 2 (NTF2) superfamily protein